MGNITSLADLEKEMTFYLELELSTYSKFFVRDIVRAIDIGCFPWNESIELSILTDYEPDLKEEYVNNPPDWRLYNFTSNCAYGSWYAAEKMAAWAKEEYEKDNNVFKDILLVCANALKSKSVNDVLLKKFKLSNDFRLIVKHPDEPDGINYCD
jgi:hypothetical protein